MICAIAMQHKTWTQRS